MVAALTGTLEGAPSHFVHLLNEAGVRSALGQKRKYAVHKSISALPPKADMPSLMPVGLEINLSS